MVLKDKKIIFLLPSKTGSSSLVKMFKDYDIKFELTPSHKHPFLSEVIENNNIQDICNYKIYQLCRNPIDRLVSAFYFQKQIIAKKEKYKHFIDLKFPEYVKLITDNVHYLPYHVNRFCHNVFNDLDFSKARSNTGYGVRFYLPQTKWNDTEDKIHYLKLEDLSKDSSILSEILGVYIKSELPKVNITRKKTTKPYIKMYNSESLKLVQDIYKDDFKLLNYELTTSSLEKA